MISQERAGDFGVVNWQRRRRRRPVLGVILAVLAGIALAAGGATLVGARGLGLAWLSPAVLIGFALIAPGFVMLSAPLTRGLFRWFST